MPKSGSPSLAVPGGSGFQAVGGLNDHARGDVHKWRRRPETSFGRQYFANATVVRVTGSGWSCWILFKSTHRWEFNSKDSFTLTTASTTKPVDLGISRDGLPRLTHQKL